MTLINDIANNQSLCTVSMSLCLLSVLDDWNFPWSGESMAELYMPQLQNGEVLAWAC